MHLLIGAISALDDQLTALAVQMKSWRTFFSLAESKIGFLAFLRLEDTVECFALVSFPSTERSSSIIVFVYPYKVSCCKLSNVSVKVTFQQCFSVLPS